MVIELLLSFGNYQGTKDLNWASQGAQWLRIHLSMQETQVRSLGDSLEEEMADHASILAWEIAQTAELGGLQTMGSQRVRCN